LLSIRPITAKITRSRRADVSIRIMNRYVKYTDSIVQCKCQIQAVDTSRIINLQGFVSA
jgi:hypothetical protein